MIHRAGQRFVGGLGRTVKRAVDLIGAAGLLCVFAAPLGVAMVAIAVERTGPIFFRQWRVGRDGREFRVWKLRTMVPDAERTGLRQTLRRGDSRVTRVGRVLRDWGLDELPQLLNVICGQMSLVGPRPTLPYQVAHYDERQRRRLEVRPGITSLAVVRGRNALSWARRIELDIWYIDHWSLWLDVTILVRTLWCVLVTREGLYGDEVNDPFVEIPTEEGET